MTYTPKVGDRVRVTTVREGIVRQNEERDWILADFNAGTRRPLPIGASDSTIEKLQDPEPEWVNGDVIRLGSTGGVFVRSGDAWRHAKTNQWVQGLNFAQHWREGILEILYKHDAA